MADRRPRLASRFHSLAAGGKLSAQALRTEALLAGVKDVINLNSNLDDDMRRNFAAVNDLEAIIGVYKLS